MAGKRGLLAAAILVLLVAVVVLPFVSQFREQALLDEAIEEAMPRAERVRSSEQALETKRALLDQLSEIDRGLPQHDAVLGELARLLPDTAYLQRLTIDGSEITMIGQAESSVAVVDLLSESPLFEDFEFVSRVTRDSRTGKERFQLKIKVKPPS